MSHRVAKHFATTTCHGLLVIALLAGCGHRVPDRELRFKSQRTDQEASLATPPAGCALHVDAIEDARHENDRFGTAHGFQLFETSILRWMHDSVASLARQGHTVTFAESATAPAGAALLLRLKVRKTYVHHAATSINANIVVTVDYLTSGKGVESKTYRGANTSVNMVGAPGEVELGLNRAMTSLLSDMSIDIDRLCRRGEPST